MSAEETERLISDQVLFAPGHDSLSPAARLGTGPPARPESSPG